MLANEHMRWGAQTMAAIFGGPGIFYIIESFARPADAITGIIYLLIATGLALSSQDRSARQAQPRHPARRGASWLALLRHRR